MFRDIEPGGVRLIRCADVADAVARLLAWGERETEHLRVVACHWPELPGAEAVLDQVLSAWPELHSLCGRIGTERDAGPVPKERPVGRKRPHLPRRDCLPRERFLPGMTRPRRCVTKGSLPVRRVSPMRSRRRNSPWPSSLDVFGWLSLLLS